MFEPDKPFDIVNRPVLLAIPVENKIYKIDIVKNEGLGIWFSDTELPSVICQTETEEDAIHLMKGFKRMHLKCQMKVVKGEDNENN